MSRPIPAVVFTATEQHKPHLCLPAWWLPGHCRHLRLTFSEARRGRA